MSTLLLMCAGLTALAYLVWLKHAALSLTPSLATQEEQKRATASASKERRLPSPTPWLDFDLATAQTRDFIYENQPLVRDFIADKDYIKNLELKKQVIAEHGPVVLDCLPECEDACGELLDMLVDWLPKRYPTLFSTLANGSGIRNEVTKVEFEDTDRMKGTAALLAISQLVQDDFLMGQKKENGTIAFTAGIVAMPGFYLLSEKIGQSLEEVHRPVPSFKEKLLLSVERTLSRFEPDMPFERTSWEIVDDENLFFHNIAKLAPGEKLNKLPAELYFRQDKQSFVKLPKTRAIAFGVHPIMRKLDDLKNSPLVPQLLREIHLKSDAALMKYKVAPAYVDTVLPYLEEMHAWQIEQGLIKGDEAVSDFRSLRVGK
ncbi:hypothetical protein EMMF5_006401 [Cystobasidiomycetes sp. EMM_F5]